MARQLHRSDLEKPTMHQAVYTRNLYVDSPSDSEYLLMWHVKCLIVKKRTRRTSPMITAPLRHVGMEAIAVGMEPLGKDVVMMEKASFY